MGLKQAVENRVQEIAEYTEKSNDFQTVLDALPPGQAKNLLKDPVIGPILEKYGITGK